MVDTDVVGCNWIELPAGKYWVRSPSLEGSFKSDAQPVSHCQIEVDVAYDEFISHSPEGWLTSRTLSLKPLVSDHPKCKDLVVAYENHT